MLQPETHRGSRLQASWLDWKTGSQFRRTWHSTLFRPGRCRTTTAVLHISPRSNATDHLRLCILSGRPQRILLGGVLLNAVRCPDRSALACRSTNFSVALPPFVRHVRALMPEVQADRPIAYLLVSQTAIFQALAQFTIQTPVLHPLIKTIDSNHRCPRHRGITTIQSRPRGRQVIEQGRGPFSPQRLQHIPRRSQSSLPEPARIHGSATSNIGHLNLLADTRGQAYVTAGEDHVGSRQSSVLRQKVFTRDAIAICEYQVVASRGRKRLISCAVSRVDPSSATSSSKSVIDWRA